MRKGLVLFPCWGCGCGRWVMADPVLGGKTGWCWDGWGAPPPPGDGVVESQNRLCLDSDVTVLNDWPHLTHLICMRQSACIRLWRHRFENCVYAWNKRHDLHSQALFTIRSSYAHYIYGPSSAGNELPNNCLHKGGHNEMNKEFKMLTQWRSHLYVQ